jgi:hypothetical protein
MSRPIYLALSVILTFSAYASCPNLAGSYSCKQATDSWNEKIVQKSVRGTTVYEITSIAETARIIADGITRSSGDQSQELEDVKYTATCLKEGVLKLILEGKEKSSGQDVYIINQFQKDTDENLIILFSGNFGNYSIPETKRICTRM